MGQLRYGQGCAQTKVEVLTSALNKHFGANGLVARGNGQAWSIRSPSQNHLELQATVNYQKYLKIKITIKFHLKLKLKLKTGIVTVGLPLKCRGTTKRHRTTSAHEHQRFMHS